MKAWLGLGGNIGDVCSTFKNALTFLQETNELIVLTSSHLYKTSPWGRVDQNDFLNLCLLIETTLDPEKLLDKCLYVEKKSGRQRIEKWGPRTLDIDILAYENISYLKTEKLTLPHPFLTERAFVLRPLNDIAPELIISGKTIRQWNAEVVDDNIEKLNFEFIV
ncbi:2-amino-4-hydroxy-6-hydroxymethyldihydropteridine diphosphokinase [Bartonella tamiae]|uniref:2-amino-4-hydroxy-6-hydroxymethyldihydropteridine pyrophosphokinase n=1 Tax=Bartonella tamiae Th239 TaxID=1094558 RepID=J0QZZ1_9HYPH|nr:2-amino-4-hydroxy-6-hydroxymethyldihydropteridine diphosphokinase [Bartonella tamiae]EJF88824.1 2-amino-4-hydroxy-6-hydroxymethyldihydropteridine pyrophosphokinase [Bartonella tamiae Th239]EJF94926.1 2-amino-4-hydroxy-6-hydroxymethyldihydropteridine pyrophosphokinase [Bartonella tamiae Th307]